MLKVGLVGVGGISRAHIPAWNSVEDVELVALCDVRPEQLAPYEGKHCYTDYDEMLRNEDLDIVDVCAPTYLHVPLSQKALEHGIHVICEKPLSLDPTDAGRLYELAEKNNCKFMVAQVLRFRKNYMILKQLYESGRYGKLLSLSMKRLCGMPDWSHDNWMAQRDKSGFVPFDVHIHDLDFCIHAFGKPKNVIRHRIDAPDQDYIHAIYEYDGFFASLEASWFAAPYRFNEGYRALFEKAILEDEYGKCTLLDLDGNEMNLEEIAEGPATVNLPASNGFFDELNYFADCVRENKPQDKVKAWEVETALRHAKAFG